MGRRYGSRYYGRVAGAKCAALLLLAALCGCGPRARPPAARTYPLRGQVVRVDRQTGTVAIRHEAIPGFMPAMTMPFDLTGQELLEDLQPGDKVRGVLRIEHGHSKLTLLEITEMALEAPPQPEALPALLPLGAAVPDFTMTTQDGRGQRLSDLRGHVVVLTFIYTRCPLPDFCPLTDQKMGRLAALIGAVPSRAAHVRLLSVSFDPDHDTPEVLARHARLRSAAPPLWTFAVATHDELRKVAESLGLTYGPTGHEIVHTLSTAVIAPDGTLARLERGQSWTPAGLFPTIVRCLPADPGKTRPIAPRSTLP